ncbi:MAG TPA: GlsB/YeaQ/YmgE family stress response membrane protein [Thermoanaerobaculia bacterium]|nr:GlsB/YeaQ/YmgE family stress response membrane protein [Thermoanaerobaculia bacterium]
MSIFHVLWSIITGFVVGLIARALLPGNDKMGFIATVCIGILGSLIGGFLGGLISKPAPGSKFHPAGFFMSVICAIALLLLWRFIGR